MGSTSTRVISSWWIVIHLVLAALGPFSLSKIPLLLKGDTSLSAANAPPPTTSTCSPSISIPSHSHGNDSNLESTAYSRQAQAQDEEEQCLSKQDESNDDKEDNKNIKAGTSTSTSPSAQHLLVDIQHVETSLLLDTDRLIEAAAAAVDSTVQSRECRSLPFVAGGGDRAGAGGVHCLFTLDGTTARARTSVTLYTRPRIGTMSLDYYLASSSTADEKSLSLIMSIVPNLERFFKLDQTTATSTPAKTTQVEWLFKKRGYPTSTGIMHDGEKIVITDNPESTELSNVLGSSIKNLMFHGKTQMQDVTVLEMPPPSAVGSGIAGVEQQQAGPEPMNKVILLDGVCQSSLRGLEPYHEALTHMALLSHPHPKRVAIIGGGEGATLREVLKHKTVDVCTMLEIDADLVDLAQEHLHEWNDCSDFMTFGDEEEEDEGNNNSHGHSKNDSGAGAGKSSNYVSCFDYPRADLQTVDAIGWFMDKFGSNAQINDAEKFDVVIMDALDPGSFVGFSDMLYGNQEFVQAIMNSLTDEGIFITQFGESYELDDDGDWGKGSQAFNTFSQLLEATNNAVAIKSYNEAHGDFEAPWGFLVVFKGYESLANFYQDPSWFDLTLAQRAIPTKSGESPFLYMDGAMATTYQYPSRVDETIYCRQSPKPSICEENVRGFDPDIPNVPASTMELGKSLIPNAGRGVFYTEDFPKGSYFALEDSVHSMIVMPGATEIIHTMLDYYPQKWSKLDNYISGYGFPSGFFGSESHVVDPGITTFVNHGCNGTNNIGGVLEVTELDADVDKMPDSLLRDPMESSFFSPFADRNYMTYATASDKLVKDIKAGEEVLDNYVGMTVDEDWTSWIQGLKASCLGQASGLVVEVENSQKM